MRCLRGKAQGVRPAIKRYLGRDLSLSPLCLNNLENNKRALLHLRETRFMILIYGYRKLLRQGAGIGYRELYWGDIGGVDSGIREGVAACKITLYVARTCVVR